MSAPDFPSVPPRVETYLRGVFWQRVRALLLTFDGGWHLRDMRGDAAYYGLEGADAGKSVQALCDLFVGMPLHEPQDVPFVEMVNGLSAHVHLIPDDNAFHVLLLDAAVERERQRVQQQLGNEEALASQAKSKAIGQLKQIRSELERQHARLEEAHALKNALIATLSHEFRTPLTSIFGYLQLIDRRAGDEPQMREALHALRRNATYLFTLAENLLEYGRGETAVPLLNPTPVDIEALVSDLDAMFRPLAEEKGLDFRVTLKLEDAAQPVFDEIRLRQILVNLLSNAVRYTRRGEITAEVVWRAQTLAVDITDTGIGIAAAHRDTVFVPFNRGGHAGSKGAGLGLSIVKRMIEHMHGTLAFESEVGRGSSFRVALPRAKERAAAHADDAIAPRFWLQGRSILVADDDPDVAHLLEGLLGDLGFRVRVVNDAQSAVLEAMAGRPDVLLIDVELSGLSGNAAVYKLRSRGYKGRIVTLSATATTEAREAALRAGADHYLTKPLNVEQFVHVMQQAASTGWEGVSDASNDA
jgi:signal transduction histidine kinase/ActR/RegA family two-component response regulator